MTSTTISKPVLDLLSEDDQAILGLNAPIENVLEDPDLVGRSFGIAPIDLVDILSAGAAFTVDFSIQNNGDLAANPFNVVFYLSDDSSFSNDDFYLGEQRVDGLDGKTFIDLFQTLALPGTGDPFWQAAGDSRYNIGMAIDFAQEVVESDENNNSGSRLLGDYSQVDVFNTLLPDIFGNGLVASETSYNAGDSVSLAIDIGNSGAQAAPFLVDFYLSTDATLSADDFLVEQVVFVDGAGANGTTPYNYTVTLPGVNDSYWVGDGSYYIAVNVDAAGEIIESNEGNNFNLGLGLDVDDIVVNNTQQSNLLGVGFDVVPEALSGDDSFNVDFSIQNTGGAVGEFQVDFYLSNDGVMGSSDDLLLDTVTITPGISANTTDSFNYTLTLPGSASTYWFGDDVYHVGMVVDSTQTVPEQDESDNANRGEGLDLDSFVINGVEQVGTRENDDLIGTPGNDTLEGLRGDDDLFGGAGNDNLFGSRGDDNLYGGSGDDIVRGNRGDDFLTGVDITAATPGFGEIDQLIGGFGSDVFFLGDTNGAYYTNSSSVADYGVVIDFNAAEDLLVLHGSASDYEIIVSDGSGALPTGLGIYDSTGEAIGVIQGTDSFDLNAGYVQYV